MLADLGKRADQPERADREGSLLAREAVVGLGDLVALDEAVDAELVGDRVDRRDDALVVAAPYTDLEGAYISIVGKNCKTCGRRFVPNVPWRDNCEICSPPRHRGKK